MINTIISLFLFGILLGSGPCLVSCGPLLISYIAGTGKGIKRSSGVYFIFSFGRLLVYALLGLNVFFLGQAAARYISHSSKYIYIFGGLFIMLTGFLMAMGRNLNHKFCRRLNDFFLKKDTKTILLFGLIVGILPCLPLVSILSYIGLASKTWAQSLYYSLCFGLGTVISPLFLLAALGGLIPRILKDNSKFRTVFNSLCGLLIIFLGGRLLLRAF